MKSTISDTQLVYRVVAQKDADAYAMIYDRYVDALYRFILFKVGKKETAEDLTSEVFLKTWHYLIEHTGDPIRNVRSLLYRIARNKIIDFYRKRARNQEDSLDQFAQVLPDTNMEGLIEVQADAARMLSLIKQMKNDYQEVIILKYIEGCTSKEIAQILDKKPTTIRVTLYRALKTLKKIAVPQTSNKDKQ